MRAVIWRVRAASAVASIALGCGCVVAATGPAPATPAANAHTRESKFSRPTIELSSSANVTRGGATANAPLSTNAGHTYAGAPEAQHEATSSGIDEPMEIAAGPDGALWFTNDGNGSIGRITTNGTVTSYTVPSIVAPFGITAGPDGALWFTNVNYTPSIGRITTSGTVTSYTSSGISSPLAITAGPDGALWFTNEGAKVIGRITTGGAVTSYTDSSINGAIGITTGPDGALWFANYGNGSPSDSIGLPTGARRSNGSHHQYIPRDAVFFPPQCPGRPARWNEVNFS